MSYSLNYVVSTPSTQDIAKERFGKSSCEAGFYYTFDQNRGRGQAGNSWFCGKGRNLAVTFALRPDSLSVEELFLFNMALSLGLLSYAKSRNGDVLLKWPNDLYLSGGKLGGVLLESSIEGVQVREIYFGAGINVNQEVFPDGIPNPTSFFLQDGRSRDLHREVRDLSEALMSAYTAYMRECRNSTPQQRFGRYRNAYLESLLFYREPRTYFWRGREVQAEITDIFPSGRLVLRQENGCRIEADLKELVFDFGQGSVRADGRRGMLRCEDGGILKESGN